MTTPLTKFGLANDRGYNVTETFDGQFIGIFQPTSNFTCLVNPTGVFMFTAILL